VAASRLSLDEWRYCREAARRKGVPDLWLDDAASDMILTCLRRGIERTGRYWLKTVHWTAIQAARDYGWVSRGGVTRSCRDIAVVPTNEHPSHDPYTWSDAKLDLERDLSHLSPQARATFAREITHGGCGDSRHHYQLHDARKQLRKAIA
jgi:hypothetical protein